MINNNKNKFIYLCKLVDFSKWKKKLLKRFKRTRAATPRKETPINDVHKKKQNLNLKKQNFLFYAKIHFNRIQTNVGRTLHAYGHLLNASKKSKVTYITHSIVSPSILYVFLDHPVRINGEFTVR